jgi:hypothetical protein
MNQTKTDAKILHYLFTAKACEFANHDLKDLQEAGYLSEDNPRVKDIFETLKAFINLEYAKRERYFKNIGNNEGIAVSKYAKDILVTHCDIKDILKIKIIVPRWFENEERWGWTAKFY